VQLSLLASGAVACLVLGLGSLVACSSSKAASSPPTADAAVGATDEGGDGGEGSGDAGGEAEAAVPYPAFPPAVAQVENGKGGVLDKAKIVTVTFTSDMYSSNWQAFDDAIVTSAYFTGVTSEYGITSATSGAANHVLVTTPPPSPWDDGDIEGWVQQMADDPTSGWPQADSETLYVVYAPSNIMVTDDGTNACEVYGGYHTEIYGTATQTPVYMALILTSCYEGGPTQLLQEATESASHEIVEGVTDPNGFNGWIGFPANDLAWSLWNDDQWEVADACEFFEEGYFVGPSDLPYWLSRIWSNAGAKAGHDPCSPVPSGPYNSVTPLGTESMSVTALIYNPDGTTSVGPYTTKGWRIAPGATATVQVGFYSDAPMDAWTVTAVEGDCCTQPWTDVLTVTPSTFTGKNGDTMSLTIEVKEAPAGRTAALLSFASVGEKNVTHFMPVVIGTY
jgi:hypothetical protein